MLRGAAERTGDAVGDGTTTSTLLAHAIVAEGVRNIAAGASAIDLKRGLDRATRVAIDALRSQSRPVQSQREKEQVATISAHNDPVIGELVARAIEKIGAEGAVTVEEAKGTETTMDIVEGLQFDRGFLSPYFVTDTEKMEAVLEDALILLYEGKVSVQWESPPATSPSSTRSGIAYAQPRRDPRISSTRDHNDHVRSTCAAVTSEGPEACHERRTIPPERSAGRQSCVEEVGTLPQ